MISNSLSPYHNDTAKPHVRNEQGCLIDISILKKNIFASEKI